MGHIKKKINIYLSNPIVIYVSFISEISTIELKMLRIISIKILLFYKNILVSPKNTQALHSGL